MLDDLLSNPWAYLPPRSSLWLWIGAPLLVLLTYYLTTRGNDERKKRLRELDIWRASVVPGEPSAPKDPHPYRPTNKGEKPKTEPKKVLSDGLGPPLVPTVPAVLKDALLKAFGGKPVGHCELVSGLAYLSLVEADGFSGSDYQSVSGRLEEKGPTFTVRPLPRVDGELAANIGVQFKKDPELMRLFLVEGADAKAIGKWLSPTIRRALCALPDAWLQVAGSTLTLSVFGTLKAPQLDTLVEVADAIFAEHGADGGASLFGETSSAEGDAPAPAVVPPADAPIKATKKKSPPATSITLSETPSSKKRS